MTGPHITPRTKAHARARYERRFARHQPAPTKRHIDIGPPPPKPWLTIYGFPQYMRLVVATLYGEKGKWGHGRYQHATKKGPGRRPIARMERIHAAGTRLIKRFIRDGRGESVAYRRHYAHLTGKQYGV